MSQLSIFLAQINKEVAKETSSPIPWYVDMCKT